MKKRIQTMGLLALFLVTLLLPSTTALAVENASWTTMAPMSSARVGMQTAVINGKIYAIGGYASGTSSSELSVYDISTNTWASLASMTTPRSSAQAKVINGKIYVIGGANGNDRLPTMEVYDPNTNTWTKLASMSNKRTVFQAEVINGKIYVMGGDTNQTLLSAVESYDPATDTWTTLASMSEARRDFQTEVINGKIYAIGGMNKNIISGAFQYLSSTEVYDPNTNTWTNVASMTTARYIHQTVVIDGKIFALGGWNNNNLLSTMEEYNPVSNTWTPLASMPVGISDFQVQVVNGNIYAMGGYGATVPGFYFYNTSSNTWTTLPSMSESRYNFGSELVGGKIYNLGGQYGSAVRSSVEMYSVASSCSAPILTATADDAQVNLSWSVVDNAVSYNVYRSATTGGPYTKVATGVTGTTYNDTDVTSGTTYYYVVTAVDSSSLESSYSNEASATLQEAGKALLRITMTTGEEKEYSMTAAQTRAFVKWANTGKDSSFYSFSNTYNLGKNTSRTDNLKHNKIAFFEVMAYDTTAAVSSDSEANTGLVRVTMSTGDEIVFETTATELSYFTTWYSNEGESSPTYAINQKYNLGPFSSRMMYIVFNEIENIEILG